MNFPVALAKAYLSPSGGGQCFCSEEVASILSSLSEEGQGVDACTSRRTLRVLRAMQPKPYPDLPMRAVLDHATILGAVAKAAEREEGGVTAKVLLSLDCTVGGVATLIALSRALTGKDDSFLWHKSDALRVAVISAVAERHPTGFPDTSVGACLHLHFQTVCAAMSPSMVPSSAVDVLSRVPTSLERSHKKMRTKGPTTTTLRDIEEQCLLEGLDDEVEVFEDTTREEHERKE